MQVRASGPQGPRIVTVVSVDRDFVTVDGNHPLAGRTLHFSLEVAEVRKATHEEDLPRPRARTGRPPPLDPPPRGAFA